MKNLLDQLVEEIATAVAEKLQAGSPTKAPKKVKAKKRWPTCPVPGCKEKFAPRYHGLCSKHRDVSAKQLAAYKNGHAKQTRAQA